MSKWIRVESDQAQEIIQYDPNGIINESFLPLFKGPFSDDYPVEVGYVYHIVDGSFSEPPTPTPPPPESEPSVSPEPEPYYINQDQFRSQLTLAEKLIWDSPDTATTPQRQAIVTVKSDFPQRVDGDQFREEVDLLEATEVIGSGRSATLLTYFSSL